MHMHEQCVSLAIAVISLQNALSHESLNHICTSTRTDASYGTSADPEGSGSPSIHTPLKTHKNIGFPSNTENHKATKPAFNVGPSSARQRNGIKLIVAFGSSLPSLTKIKVVKVRPPLTKLSGSAHGRTPGAL